MDAHSPRGDGMIVTQISDVHLRDDGLPLKQKIDTEAALEAAIDHINGWEVPPDAVLATGDLVQKAKHQNYANIRRKLDRLCAPYFVIPGNHDDRALMRETFADHDYIPPDGEFIQYVVEGEPLRLIGLDTMIPGENGGETCANRCQWLDDRLAEKPDQPTLIFMHPPPFPTGVDFLDRHKFKKADRLKSVIEKHDQVVWITCGHLHRQLQVRWAGTVAAISPSVAFQLPMALQEGASKGFSLEPAGCPVYIWKPETGLVSHMSLIGEFGGLHPFVRDPIV
ncbi:MAG TPA: phosphodiesterase [Rhodospirillaceae bacterium]|nr:phosphodiesterase [Rhodospirillaceae bacterium]